MVHAHFATEFADFTAVSSDLPSVFLAALGIKVVNAPMEQAITALLAPGRKRAFFMNAHCCNLRRTNKAYANAVAQADILLPDGIGIELAARMTGDRLVANLNGTDLVPALLARAAKQNKSVYLFGGTPGTADAAASTLAANIPGIRIAGTRDGFAGAADREATIEDINASGADIVLVALGAPLQELWLHENAYRLNAPLTFAVGALFDFLAGTVSRAPEFMRRARMEWVWRLAQEPQRLAKRYILGNPSFLVHAAGRALRQVPVADIQRRFLDITVSVSALILLSPLLLLTVAAIKLDSRGPALFKQTRIGRNGTPFTIFKFRSMTTDAEARRDDLLDSSDREGVCFKARHDPRVTRVGRFIRRFSIDELPQILNVLRGEMAIVGPRPALPSEVSHYPKRAIGRLSVKPGITGVWQVSGRANIDFDHMVEMDLSYADSRTVLMDVVLIAKTFGAVFSGRGAY